MRKQQTASEVAELRPAPSILKTSEILALRSSRFQQHPSVVDRLTDSRSRREMTTARIAAENARKELSECTHRPAIGKNSAGMSRGVSQLFRWKEERDTRLSKMREEKTAQEVAEMRRHSAVRPSAEDTLGKSRSAEVLAAQLSRQRAMVRYQESPSPALFEDSTRRQSLAVDTSSHLMTEPTARKEQPPREVYLRIKRDQSAEKKVQAESARAINVEKPPPPKPRMERPPSLAGGAMSLSTLGILHRPEASVTAREVSPMPVQRGRTGCPGGPSLLDMSVVERNRIWLQAREAKLLSESKRKEATALDGCTFQPQLRRSSRPVTPDMSLAEASDRRASLQLSGRSSEQRQSYSQLHSMRKSLHPQSSRRTPRPELEREHNDVGPRPLDEGSPITWLRPRPRGEVLRVSQIVANKSSIPINRSMY
eukprot:TRINITY_DN3401_c0_g1_i8.p1 TRINITY_DN3401_c0_g1~~TRINITY_DN3401_c0_g1_i8.p1  ORF type:complete len:425 (-),score=74.14 TRINITY_DN3401_c0_g1_i8:1786-3060(-)